MQNNKIAWTETGQQAFLDGIFRMSLEPFMFEVAKPQCENTNRTCGCVSWVKGCKHNKQIVRANSQSSCADAA